MWCRQLRYPAASVLIDVRYSMAFADLPLNDQLDTVSEALQSLLGDDPSKMDYVLLCRAARAIVEALEEAIIMAPLPGWTQASR